MKITEAFEDFKFTFEKEEYVFVEYSPCSNCPGDFKYAVKKEYFNKWWGADKLCLQCIGEIGDVYRQLEELE